MKKFLIQVFVLLALAFGGLMIMFRPEMFGMNSLIPGGGSLSNSEQESTGSANTNNQNQVLFIDAASTGNPELVKAILNVELANTPEKRGRGLSYRDNMDSNSGMVFLFDSASKVRFIMTGMRFPLDFIWVRDGVIVDLLENVPPDPGQTAAEAKQTYSPNSEVNRVIEVNAGYVKAHNLKVGDRVKLN